MPRGVYKIVKVDKSYTLTLNEQPYLEVPKKIYGKAAKYAMHFYNTFKYSDKSLGVLLTGTAGSGKTELSNMIGNIALRNDMCVVIVANLTGDLELANLIDSLENAVVIFDEFGKMFPVYVQENMLTMFSNSIGGKKLYILTENDKNMVSRFIRDRPGRIRYHIEFDRLDRDVIEEYCADHNVSETFYEELISIYDKSTVFSFDQLQTLVSEHKISPESKLSDLIKILNLKVLGNVVKVVPTRAYKVDSEGNIIEEYDISNRNGRSLTKYDFDNGMWMYIDIKKKSKEDDGEPKFSPTISVRINNGTVIKIEGDVIYCKENDIIIELNFVETK